MEPISLVRLIDSLQEAGLIERRPHAHDRRIRTLWLTEAARPILAQVRSVAEDVRALALTGIPEAEREGLLDLLVAVRENLATQGCGWLASQVRDGDAETRPAVMLRRKVVRVG